MLVLTVNSGSTSAKLAAFERSADATSLARVRYAQYPAASLDPREALGAFVRALGGPPVAAVGHRVVHGGTRFVQPVVIDAEAEAALRGLAELAPLHNPLALEWIAAARSVCPPQTLQVAAFDTAFFADLPPLAGYALPHALGRDLGIRRYGFHGLAHEAMWRRWCEGHPERPGGGRVITLQLGGGCSMAAIDRGRPIDTSMGFSPLEGLVMATRSGDLDPAVVPYLARKLQAPAERIIDLLNHDCGLLGVSGLSGDLRALLAAPAEAARFAVELYCYRARKYVGAYFAALGGCDGIVFGGGVGEHMPEIRERILAPLAWAGVELDPQANDAARGGEARIGRSGAPVEVQVIPVDEEDTLARAALACLMGQARAAPGGPRDGAGGAVDGGT